MAKMRLEFKREDMWIGLFWRRTRELVPDYHPTGAAPMFREVTHTLDVWVCLIPCFPLHITRTRTVVEP